MGSLTFHLISQLVQNVGRKEHAIGGGNPRQRHRLLSSVCVLVTKSCPTLCDPMDCSLPGSSVLGILQARILEWVAIPFSSGSSRPRDRTWVSCTDRQILYCLSHQGSPLLTSINLALYTIHSHQSLTCQKLHLSLKSTGPDPRQARRLHKGPRRELISPPVLLLHNSWYALQRRQQRNQAMLGKGV